MLRTLMAAVILSGLLSLPTHAVGEANPNDTTGTKNGGAKAKSKADSGKMAAAKKKEKEALVPLLPSLCYSSADENGCSDKEIGALILYLESQLNDI